MEIFIDKKVDKKVEEYLINNERSAITQSGRWFDFQKNLDTRKDPIVLWVEDNHEIIGACIIEVHKLFKNFTWLYTPRGPVFDNIKVLEKMILQISKIAKEQNAIWYRMDPLVISLISQNDEINKEKGMDEFLEFMNKNGFRWAHSQYQPLSTRIVDLKESEDDILKQMRQSGRRYIKKAQNAEIIIESFSANQISEDILHNLVDKYYEMEIETTDRDNFFGHQKSFYFNFIKNLKDNCRIYFAKKGDEVFSSAITTFYGKKAIYYYGVSTTGDKDGASYLLQWQMMKDAKKYGCEEYDFLGVVPPDEKKPEKHPYKGISYFKRMFGGKVVKYVGAYEKIYNKKIFFLILFIKFLRRNIRRTGVRL